eukprot:1176424-Prorocentrum_minimum.AAC.1
MAIIIAPVKHVILSLHFTGPPVPITARMLSTPQRPFPFSHPVSGFPPRRTCYDERKARRPPPSPGRFAAALTAAAVAVAAGTAAEQATRAAVTPPPTREVLGIKLTAKGAAIGSAIALGLSCVSPSPCEHE